MIQNTLKNELFFTFKLTAVTQRIFMQQIRSAKGALPEGEE